MTQTERLARRDQIRAQMAKREAELAELRAEETRLLERCEHTLADGRSAAAGATIRLCSLCGRVLKGRDEKLWG